MCVCVCVCLYMHAYVCLLLYVCIELHLKVDKIYFKIIIDIEIFLEKLIIRKIYSYEIKIM